jgi:hypothetical protein
VSRCDRFINISTTLETHQFLTIHTPNLLNVLNTSRIEIVDEDHSNTVKKKQVALFRASKSGISRDHDGLKKAALQMNSVPLREVIGLWFVTDTRHGARSNCEPFRILRAS